MPRNILILTALRFEAVSIARELGLHFETRDRASDHNGISLQIIGPRARQLPTFTPSLCAGVILAGLGGGLIADLKRGDVIVDAQSTLTTDSTTFASLRRAKFVTADDIVSTPAEKMALHQRTGGAVVDMESEIVRAWAAQRGLDFLGIRAISDTSSETLHPAILRLVDDRGFLQPMQVLKQITSRPTVLPALMRLRHSDSHLRALSRQLRALFAA